MHSQHNVMVQSITGEKAIRSFQLKAQMSAVKLEKLGMKHSGGNITPKLKKHYGLPRTATYDQVLERLQLDRDALELP